ncbi:universal stress protein [Amycolatopsis sp. H20-H5]|uniref:universal stress protein n=1 Tax=Amycolatopsis sp. H20-H5 TaxID=3046309 RepID=UPI002DB5F43A|nr:universal stress protein [Amycolatopsis sp. H20-H5]MEC3982600.1 universal stress protein [Amycolatopsis sp. H20-H5]
MTYRRRATAPIAVGIDGSAACLAATKWAAREAARADAELVLVHATAFSAAELDHHLATRDNSEDVLLAAGDRQLARAVAVARAVAPEVRVTSELGPGTAAKLLISRSSDAGMLVVGSHGVNAAVGLLLGSVAAAVAAGAHCPVIVVRDDPPDAGPIVVGVDVTADNDPALGFAFAAASRAGAGLIAMNAWYDEAGTPTAMRLHEVEACVVAWSAKYPDVVVDLRVVKDMAPARALLAQTAGAQLLVVGSRGRGQLETVIRGSSGASLLYRASCPVAIVHDRLTPDRSDKR